MAGFDNDVVFANNVDFTGGFPVVAQVTTDAQLLIGSTAAPNIRVGNLTSTGGSITISYVSPNINIEAGGAVASNYPVDNGGPGVPLANAMSILGSSSSDFTGSGNETHVGATTNEIYLENRRWLSAYVVDPSPTVGLRGEYTTIQSAINAANGAGGGTVYVRPGTYTENLTLRASVDIVGATADARKGFNLPASGVFVIGNNTYAGNGTCSIANVSFTSAAGDTFTISPVVVTSYLKFFQCSVISSAARAMVLTGSVSSVSAENSWFISNTTGFDVSGSSVYALENCQLLSTGGGVNILHGSTASNATVKNCTLQGDTGLQITNAAGAVEMLNNKFTESTGIQFSAAATVTSHGNTFNCSSGSGNYIAGVTGTYKYTDDALQGTALNIAAGVTQNKYPWRARATAGNSATAYAGTAGFDSINFTVTDGFVQLDGSTVGQTITGDNGVALSPTAGNWNIVGGPGVTTSGAGDTLTINSVVWTSRGGSATVLVDSGTFDISGGTATFLLPAVPLQGEECRFVCINSGGVVQANAGQAITIGNTSTGVGGTATSTQGGDTLYLTFNADTLRWFSIATTGTWILV